MSEEVDKIEKTIEYCKKINDFSLIENLKIPITVQIADKKMRFKELLNMGTGSIIKFNKMITEPVEVKSRSRVIAKAHVVTVRDKFAVKITEVIK